MNPEKKAHPNQIKGCDVQITEQDGQTRLIINGQDVTDYTVQYQLQRMSNSDQSALIVGLRIKSLNLDEQQTLEALSQEAR